MLGGTFQLGRLCLRKRGLKLLREEGSCSVVAGHEDLDLDFITMLGDESAGVMGSTAGVKSRRRFMSPPLAYSVAQPT